MLSRMLIVQALTVGLIGYGVGVGLSALFGYAVLDSGMPPFYMPWQLPVFTFVVILIICLFAALMGISKVRKLEAAIVFRG